MKIRNGFVSNNSSSSFLILSKEELDKNKLMELFLIPKESPLYIIGEQIADFIISEGRHNSIEEIMYNYGYEEEDLEDHGYMANLIKKARDEKWEIYEGYASNEDSGVGAYFCDIDLDIKTDDLIIYKEGGY